MFLYKTVITLNLSYPWASGSSKGVILQFQTVINQTRMDKGKIVYYGHTPNLGELIMSMNAVFVD